MDSTRYSRAKEALKKQNTRSGNLKDYKAHARSTEAKSSRAWTSSGPSPLGKAPRHLCGCVRCFDKFACGRATIPYAQDRCPKEIVQCVRLLGSFEVVVRSPHSGSGHCAPTIKFDEVVRGEPGSKQRQKMTVQNASSRSAKHHSIKLSSALPNRRSAYWSAISHVENKNAVLPSPSIGQTGCSPAEGRAPSSRRTQRNRGLALLCDRNHTFLPLSNT